MFKKILLILIFIFLLSLFFYVFAERDQEAERGVLSIYFMEEKVGYEEYTWQSDEMGYLLSVRGRLTKPTAIEIESLTLRLDKNFIPSHFSLKGSISGMAQEISSSIVEGQVENTIQISGQEQKSTDKIKSDAFLLPNPVFSCYMVITKKFQCTLQETVELSAYIVPQFEIPFTLEPREESPCSLIMRLSGIEIKLETDEEGNLKSIHIPSQNLKVIKKKT